MAPVPETPGPRNAHARALRRTAERQQMRLERSARRDPNAPHYGTYVLSRSGDGPVLLRHASLQEINDHLQMNSSLYTRVPPGERSDAVEGSIVGITPGVVIDNLKNDKRFIVTEDGELVELPDEGWATLPDSDR